MKKPLLLLGLVVLFGCSSKPVRSQQTGLTETYNPDTIEAAMLANRQKYLECYSSQFSQSKHWPAGRVLTQFLISEDGRVSEAKIKESTLKQPQVENCILEVIKSTEFPKPKKRGTTSVEYPFKFNGKGR